MRMTGLDSAASFIIHVQRNLNKESSIGRKYHEYQGHWCQYVKIGGATINRSAACNIEEKDETVNVMISSERNDG